MARGKMFRTFSIGYKISVGFSVVIIATFVAFIITNQTFVKSREINEEITNNHNPTIAKLEELKLMIVRSKMLINNWAYQTTPPENEDKVALNNLSGKEYSQLKVELEGLSQHWETGDDDLDDPTGDDPADEDDDENGSGGNQSPSASVSRSQVQSDTNDSFLLVILFDEIESLWAYHDMIKNTLSGVESYNDPFNLFSSQTMVEEGGEIDAQTDKIIKYLNELIHRKKEKSAKITQEMLGSFEQVQILIYSLGFALTLAGIIIAFLTTRTIVSPVRKLRLILLDLSKGIFPKSWIESRGDEIGEMANALETVVTGLRRTKDFAISVGSGTYNSDYTPLSDQDELGQSLLIMRKNLKEYAEDMEEKVRERTAEVVRQKEEIQKQSEQIAELYEQVKDSILYAKRIQEAILPSKEEIDQALQHSMVLFRPKDIVSGDFYWFSEKTDCAIIAAADCTGHGVPGALMSMIGSSLLNEIVNEKGITRPADILLALKHGVIKALNKHPSADQTKDGMDIALISIPKKGNVIEFAGANNPLWMVRNGDIIDYRGDRQPVGIYGDNLDTPYTNHEIEVQPGDAVYIFSDGYADQFGGNNGKKFKYSQFKTLLVEIREKPMLQQRDILNRTIEDWMGDEEQIDDILVIGIKF